MKNIANKLSIYFLKLGEQALFSIKAEMDSKYHGQSGRPYVPLVYTALENRKPGQRWTVQKQAADTDHVSGPRPRERASFVTASCGVARSSRLTRLDISGAVVISFKAGMLQFEHCSVEYKGHLNNRSSTGLKIT